MLAASSVRCGGSARARAGRGVWIARRSAAGGRARPGCDGGPGLALLRRSPRRTSHRPTLDGRQPPALASCSGRWSLSAAKVPVRGRFTAPGCHVGQDPDQPAGCPVGFQLRPAAGSHVRSAPHSRLTCENVGACHLADVRSLATSQAVKDQIRRPQRASELRKRGAKGTRTPGLLHAMKATQSPPPALTRRDQPKQRRGATPSDSEQRPPTLICYPNRYPGHARSPLPPHRPRRAPAAWRGQRN
jgi:hypothetical protein